jgi:hypothetical protein
MESAISNVEYERLLTEIKQQISSAQTRAALAVNRELVLLYWQIGRQIAERQEVEGWGAKVIDRLAADLGKGCKPKPAEFIYRPGSRQVASTKPRSQRCAGSASRRGCHICETVIASVRTGSGKLLTSAGPGLA